MKKALFLLITSAILFNQLSGCSSGNSSPKTKPVANTVASKTNCPDDINNNKYPLITALPDATNKQYKNNFCKYTKLTAPNGKPIHFYAQHKISNAQMMRARGILKFYLTDVPGSTYGSDKSAVFNKMADNNATLIMLNGSDDDNPPAEGQTLYETENIIEGSAAYLVNNPRDAAFEEILHLLHDTGIGVDAASAPVGALPSFQAEIRAATNNAAPSSIVTGGKGLWASSASELDWLRELKAEGSLTQEYLASVIDTYYGLAGQSSANGLNSLYSPQTRTEISTKDPMGWNLVGNNSPRKFFSEYITYFAKIDPSFTGTFTLTFDPATKYTHKSQYLTRVKLQGSKNTNLTGNDQPNWLHGNKGDNVISGGKGNDVINGADGSDTAVFSGNSSEYMITGRGSHIVVEDKIANRDGRDLVLNIELLTFADTSITR